jgi:YegS/Rv2252/BmrU family lipid kinase
VETFRTAEPGQATARAKSVGDEVVDRLVVVGGDGTLNEVLNGLPDPSAVPLAQLATGTANILAHELGLPRDAEGAARLVETGGVCRIDMGLAGERRFLMVASSGFDAMVTREIARHRVGTLGYRGYVRPVVRTLTGYVPPEIDVRVDGGPPIRGELVVVCNTRNYGGLFAVAEKARCDSGHLDVVVLPDASYGGLWRAAAGGLTGGASRLPDARYLTGTRIDLSSAEPVPVEVDGDYAGVLPLRIEVRPSLVPIVVPAEP